MPRDEHAVIYFVQSIVSRNVKIGFTTNIVLRLKSFKTACAEPLRVIATFDGGSMEEERELHRRFDAYRLQGEWFLPAREIMLYVAERIARDAGMVLGAPNCTGACTEAVAAFARLAIVRRSA